MIFIKTVYTLLFLCQLFATSKQMASQFYCQCLNVCLRVSQETIDTNSHVQQTIKTVQKEFGWGNGIIVGSTIMAGVQIVCCYMIAY